MDIKERKACVYAGMLTVDFLLSRIEAMARFCENDLTQTVIFYAIWRANVRHRYENGLDPEFPFPHPDEDRRPVTVLEIANETSIPYETARRHVNRLRERGICHRTPDGVVIYADVFMQPEMLNEVMKNRYDLENLVDTFLQAGLRPAS
jgi:hypothetical protein